MKDLMLPFSVVVFKLIIVLISLRTIGRNMDGIPIFEPKMSLQDLGEL